MYCYFCDKEIVGVEDVKFIKNATSIEGTLEFNDIEDAQVVHLKCFKAVMNIINFGDSSWMFEQEEEE